MKSAGLSYDGLLQAVRTNAAIRRRRRLQPSGGAGDKLFPPTYPGEGNDPPRHVFETRRIGGESVTCVLLDSVQSQANRLEEALKNAAEAGRIRLPRLFVDFPGAGLNSVPAISVLDAPHRIFDAILRDSLIEQMNSAGEIELVSFLKSELGKLLVLANWHDATAILQAAPTALLFGSWNSTGTGGGLGAKFARSIVSEIVAVNVPVEPKLSARRGGDRVFQALGWRENQHGPSVVIVDPGSSEIQSAGRRTGSRIDPLGISREVTVYHSATDPSDWTPDPNEAVGGPKNPKPFDRKGAGGKAGTPAKINHGNIPPTIQELGITCDYAEQTCVITLAGLRRLRFESGNSSGQSPRNEAARAYLAALGLVALAETDSQGYALRSRCDLVCAEPDAETLRPGQDPRFALIAFDGTPTHFELDAESARSLHETAFDAAVGAGLKLNATPVLLKPKETLLHIVRQSRDKALRGEGVDTEG